MQELVERDKKIVGLQNEVRDLKEVTEDTVNNTYYDGISLAGIGKRKKSKNTLYQSQQIYNVKGLNQEIQGRKSPG